MTSSLSSILSFFRTKGVSGVPSYLTQFGTHFNFNDFKTARSHGTAKQIRDSILSISVNLHKFDPSTSPPPTGNVALLICNTYSKPHSPEPVGPLNDCATVANYFRRIDFTVYFLCNPNRDRFLNTLKYFFAAETITTFIYFNGIAATVPAGPEIDDGYDEVLNIGGENISDDVLADTLSKSGKIDDRKVVIVSESCHTGYSWNLTGTTFNGYILSKGVLSIANRRNGSKEEDLTSEGREDAGVFTLLLFRLLNDNQGITVSELEAKLNGYLAKYQQFVIGTATSPELLEQPLMEPWMTIHQH
jgi:hypothetical protein